MLELSYVCTLSKRQSVLPDGFCSSCNCQKVMFWELFEQCSMGKMFGRI